MWLLVTIFVCSAALAGALFVVALWGRARGRTIFCRRCGYDLTGVWPPEPWKQSRCTECGGTLWLVNAVKEGTRPRRARALVAAWATAAVAGLSGSAIGWGTATGFDWHTVEPESMLLRQAQGAARLEADASLKELTARGINKKLSDGGLRSLAEWAIGRGDDAAWPNSVALGRCDVIEMAWGKGLLEREQKAAYVHQIVQVSLKQTGRTRVITDEGDMIPLRLSCTPKARATDRIDLIVRERVLSASLKGVLLLTAEPGVVTNRLGPVRYESGGDVLVDTLPLMEADESVVDANVEVEVYEGTAGRGSTTEFMRPVTEDEIFPERFIASWTMDVSTPSFAFSRKRGPALVRQDRYREGVYASLGSMSVGAGLSNDGQVFFLMHFKPKETKIAMCFNAYLRIGDEELAAAQELCVQRQADEQSCTVTFGASGIDIPMTVDVVLRPSASGAQKARLGDIWGEDVVIKGVRVNVFGGETSK